MIELFLEFSPTECELAVESPIVIRQSDVPLYDGPMEFTPTQSEQIIYTANTRFVDNVTINPIPSNYGLITWNGSTLTVS